MSGWHSVPGFETKGKVGWLQNADRAKRVEEGRPFDSKDARSLIDKISSLVPYTKLKDEILDSQLKMRDKALISTAWLFFKRGGENLSVKLGGVHVENEMLRMTFHIEKKIAYYLKCGSCYFENKRMARRKKDGEFAVCRRCNVSLENSERIVKRLLPLRIKARTLKNPFTRYIVEWKEALEAMGAGPNSWFFPRFSGGREFVFESEHPMTVQRLDQILQRLDPSITSHMFRYGHALALFDKGYTPFNVAVIGDWDSSSMPEVYARRFRRSTAQVQFENELED